MADLSLPTSQIQGSNQVAQGGTSHGNSAIASQPAGTVLQGFIINRDASGNPIVRTDKGDIPFSTNYFLKIGSEVVVRVGNTSGTNTAQLISVDGQPPEEAQNQSSYAQQPGVILSPNISQPLTAAPLASTASTAANPVQEPQTTITVSGTVIAQTPLPQTSTAPQEQAVSNGTQLTLKVVSITTPTNNPAVETPQVPATQDNTLPQATSAFYATYARAAGTTPATATPPVETTAEPTSPSVTTPAAAIPQLQTTSLPTAPATAIVLPAPTAETPTATVQAGNAVPQAPANTTVAGPVLTPAAAPVPATAVNAAPLPAANVPATTTPNVVTTPEPPVAAIAPSTILPQPAVASTTTPPPAQPSEPTIAATQITNPLLQPGTNVTATVIGNESSGETLVQSQLGVVRLQTGTPVPTGSTISFEILQSVPPSAVNTPIISSAAQQPAPLTELAQQWTSLQQVFSILTGRTLFSAADELLQPPTSLPAGNASNIQTTPANVTAQTISSGLLNYISSLRSGDFDGWLGSVNSRALQDQGHDDLLKKVQAEFSNLSRQFTQTPPNHWQALFFPIANDGNVSQARIFVKRDRKQGNQQDKGKKGDDTRFVIEVGLSQLGELQMDGFVRKQEKNMQFDMVIRSLTGLSNEIQNDILRIYNDMGAITGYTGSITFQSVKAFPVNPMQEIVETHNTVMA